MLGVSQVTGVKDQPHEVTVRCSTWPPAAPRTSRGRSGLRDRLPFAGPCGLARRGRTGTASGTPPGACGRPRLPAEHNRPTERRHLRPGRYRALPRHHLLAALHGRRASRGDLRFVAGRRGTAHRGSPRDRRSQPGGPGTGRPPGRSPRRGRRGARRSDLPRAGRTGTEPVLIERNRVGMGSTAWSGGIVRGYHDDPVRTDRAVAGWRDFHDFAARTGEHVPLTDAASSASPGRTGSSRRCRNRAAQC